MEATVRVKTCAPAPKDISETDAITQVSVFINISGGGGGDAVGGGTERSMTSIFVDK